MAYYEFIWTDEMIDHLAEHGVSPDDFEEVVSEPDRIGYSRSSGAPCCWGETSDGRFLFCVYDLEDDRITVIPRTAYDTRRLGQ